MARYTFPHTPTRGGQEPKPEIQNFLLIGGYVYSTDIARELSPISNIIYQSHPNGQFDLSASLLPENGILIDEVIAFPYLLATLLRFLPLIQSL